MIQANRVRNSFAVAAAAAMLALSIGPSSAADKISASHMKAAYAAISAIKATEAFDEILPEAAQALKQQLIEKDPNLQSTIVSIVDKDTLALVGRRADLEKESAAEYAKVFSEQELNAIAAFYTSPAGQKLLENGPVVTRQLGQAAEIWQRGVARDLAQTVGKQMQAVEAKDANGPQPQPQPAKK